MTHTCLRLHTHTHIHTSVSENVVFSALMSDQHTSRPISLTSLCSQSDVKTGMRAANFHCRQEEECTKETRHFFSDHPHTISDFSVQSGIYTLRFVHLNLSTCPAEVATLLLSGSKCPRGSSPPIELGQKFPPKLDFIETRRSLRETYSNNIFYAFCPEDTTFIVSSSSCSSSSPVLISTQKHNMIDN